MTLIFDSVRTELGDATFTWDGDAVQAVLYDDGGLWTPSASDATRDDILSAGATARGTIANASLTGRTVSIVSHKLIWDLNDLTFTVVTSQAYTHVVFCRDTGVATTDKLISVHDLAGTTSGVSLAVAIAAGGLLSW